MPTQITWAATHFSGKKRDVPSAQTSGKSLPSAIPYSIPPFFSAAIPPAVYRADKFFSAAASPAMPLSSAALPAGFEAISLPGHSIGMTGFRTPDGVVFLGDALCSEKSLAKYHINYVYNVEEYLKSFETAAQTAGTVYVCCHGPLPEDVKALSLLNRENTLRILEDICSLCETALTFDALLKAVFDLYALRFTPGQALLVGAALRSYLTYLTDRGTLLSESTENTQRFKRRI